MVPGLRIRPLQCLLGRFCWEYMAKQFNAIKTVSTVHIHINKSRSYQHVFFTTLIARLFNTFKRIFGATWHILCWYATELIATKPNLSSSRFQRNSFATQRHEFDIIKLRLQVRNISFTNSWNVYDFKFTNTIYNVQKFKLTASTSLIINFIFMT